MITGIRVSACAYMSAGSYTNRVVFHTRRRYSAAMTPATFWNAREPTIRFTNDIAVRSASGRRPPVGAGIEQPMHVDDEVAHVGVVDGLLRLRLPGRISGGVVRINSDDIELVEVLEFDLVDTGELATDHEVKQLSRIGLIGHGSVLGWVTGPWSASLADHANSASRSRIRPSSIL